jgi:tRNA(fMet)-specific endonuclease VapC
MPYLIDTDVVIDHLTNQADATELLEHLSSDGIAISVVSYMEAYQGVLRSVDRQRANAQLEAFLASTPILPFSPRVAVRCAELREQLSQEGRRIRARALDLMIAATGLEHDLTLVTRNTRDYSDIPGIVLHGWE